MSINSKKQSQLKFKNALPEVYCILIIFFYSNTIHSFSSASAASTAEIDRYQNLPPIVFTPGGKLPKVEQNTKSSSDVNDLSSPLSLALHCEDKSDEKDFVLVVSTRSQSPNAYLTSSPAIPHDDSISNERNSIHTPLLMNHIIFSTETKQNGIPTMSRNILNKKPLAPMMVLGKTLFAVAGGNAIDTNILLRRVQEMYISLLRANENFDAYVPTGVLARRLADSAQIATQDLGGKGGRMLMSSALIVGSDIMKSPRKANPNTTFRKSRITNNIWRIDPTGQFWNCNAAAVGRGAGIAEVILMRRVAYWKKQNEKNKNTSDENSDNNDESMLNDDEDMSSLLLHMSNNDVKDYLSRLNYNDALKLATDVIFETLESQHQHSSNRKIDEGCDGDNEEWIKFRDLQCIILDTSSMQDNVDAGGVSLPRSSPGLTDSQGRLRYLDNNDIWDRVGSKQNTSKA